MEKLTQPVEFNFCPDNCPVCGKPLLMVFRHWSDDCVTIEYLHDNFVTKDCERKFNSDTFEIIDSPKVNLPLKNLQSIVLMDFYQREKKAIELQTSIKKNIDHWKKISAKKKAATLLLIIKKNAKRRRKLNHKKVTT